MLPPIMLRRTLTPLVLAASLLALAPVARAQDEAPETTYTAGRAPVPTKADNSPPRAWMYLFILILVAAIIGTNMIPSKRGHQD